MQWYTSESSQMLILVSFVKPQLNAEFHPALTPSQPRVPCYQIINPIDGSELQAKYLPKQFSISGQEKKQSQRKICPTKGSVGITKVVCYSSAQPGKPPSVLMASP